MVLGIKTCSRSIEETDEGVLVTDEAEESALAASNRPLVSLLKLHKSE